MCPLARAGPQCPDIAAQFLDPDDPAILGDIVRPASQATRQRAIRLLVNTFRMRLPMKEWTVMLGTANDPAVIWR
jgi:hypothetical protein